MTKTTTRIDAVDRQIGAAVRTLRMRRGLTMRACAELCGNSEEWLRLIESGRRPLDRLSTVTTLAVVLGVDDLAVLLGPKLRRLRCTLRDSAHVQHEAVPVLRRLLSTPTYPQDSTRDPYTESERIRRRLSLAWSAWHRSDRPYTALGLVVPDLLRDALALHRASPATGRRLTWQLLSETFQMAQRFLYCVGEPHLAARAADRAMVAAEETDDPALIAVSAWSSTMAALGRAEADEAHAIAHDATGHLHHLLTTSPAAMSTWGALHLFDAIAHARLRRPADAWRSWRIAQQAANALEPDHHHPLTMFGRANVAIYAVAINVETGQAANAIKGASRIDLNTIPSINRRAQHLIDLAHGHLRRNDTDAAITALLTSEQQSGEPIAFNPAAGAVITEIVEGSKRPPRAALDLAARILKTKA
ncbi:helix-turn-helix transcriptional regulator [Nonomuraea sp. NPDC046802]|uniref:helix-turn-helix domain-containing protein n=1 Tax=Nonomuraea sp. NPDC046802 TaxID=3154919 RepID=UPI0033C3EEB3